jgi:DNA polymerase bacteriophage-type
VRVHLDFETRSEISVKDVGASVYTRHPSTEIISLAYCVDDDPVIHFPMLEWGTAFYDHKLGALAADPTVIFVAHNAMFEQCIWKHIVSARYGHRGHTYVEIPIERWRCTAAKAAAMSLPRDLEGVGKALNLAIQKDEAGHRVMMKLSRPRPFSKKNGRIQFWEPEDAPSDFEALYEYNKTDVETERLVDKALPDLNAFEQRVWFMDQEINFRGVCIDLEAVETTLGFIEKTTEELLTEFRTLTGDVVESPSQVAKLKTWLAEECSLEIDNLQKTTVATTLREVQSSEKAYRALEIRQALGKTSVGKYRALMNRTDKSDGRCRDLFLYCGAHTTRWTGRGVQPQNFPRETGALDARFNHLSTGDYSWYHGFYPNAMESYSQNLRGVFIAPPGKELLVSDFNAIEARVLAWLSGHNELLDLFERGDDIYCKEAASTFSRQITKKDKYERQVGKVEVLALGYQGGINAFGTMAKGYNVDLSPAYSILWPGTTEEERERARKAYDAYVSRQTAAENMDILDRSAGLAADVIKQRYRSANRAIVDYWADVEGAAIRAVLTGEKQQIGGYGVVGVNSVNYDPRPRVIFAMMDTYLLCQVPSGLCLVFPEAKVSNDKTPWGADTKKLSYKAQNEDNYQYGRVGTYGGKLVENITQKVARDLLSCAMLRVEADACPIVLHCHDEIVSEVPENYILVEQFNALLEELPPWADGSTRGRCLPLKAEGFKTKRWKK